MVLVQNIVRVADKQEVSGTCSYLTSHGAIKRDMEAKKLKWHQIHKVKC